MCDTSGSQLNPIKGDWCYIKESPCKMLSGSLMTDTNANPWLRCTDTDGNDQVRCQAFGNNLFQAIF